ncbi:MAG: hypothetical protein QOH21_2983 [Acidobacteriota bacterium]|jgi:hypothetical protein|nr:hypothetical protein [Acidobacteriota bacterium]
MSRRAILTLLGVFVILVATMVTTGVLVWRLAKKTVQRQILTPKEETLDLTAVVTQVRELNRLETASMRVVHVGTIKQSYNMLPNSIAGDEITFLATGDVIAGVDLARLQPGDIWREPDGTVVLRLPAPELLVSRVDNEQSHVMSRKTGVLRRADIDLETRARQHAEENIRREALRKGILPMAGTNAEKKLADLLHSMGARRVRFVQPRGGRPSER